MKKTATRLFAFLLVVMLAVPMLLMNVSAEQAGSMQESAKWSQSSSPIQDSSSSTPAGSKPFGIFATKLDKDGDAAIVASFLVQDSNGRQFLVMDNFFKSFLENGYSITIMTSSNNYKQSAKYLGSDDLFSYLEASGLSAFDPLTISGTIPNTGYAYIEQTNEAGTSCTGLGYVETNLSSMEKYSNGSNYVYVDMDTGMSMTFMGAPVLAPGDYKVFGMMSAHEQTYAACFTFTSWSFPSSYAVSGSSSSGGSSGGSSGSSSGGGSSNGGSSNGGSSSGGSSGGGSSSSGFSFTWIAVIAVVAVVVYMLYRSNTRNKNAGPKEGTVALEKTTPASQSMDNNFGNTVPLGEDFGPTVPNYGATVPMSQWQLRSLGGKLGDRTYPLTGKLTLGRNPKCDIVFPEGTPGISGTHCEISVEGDSVVLRDLSSTYGTYMGVNNRLEANRAYHLNVGDTFTLAQNGQSFRVEQMGMSVESYGPEVRSSSGKVYKAGASGRITFGRNNTNRVVFPADDHSISGNHCVLYHEGSKLYLMDLGSTNGTFFNEKDRLKPNTPYRIRKGMAFFLTSPKNTFVVTED